MPQVEVKSVHIAHEELRGFCARLLFAAGFATGDAALAADALVETNLRGIDSHGVARLPHYLRRIKAGSIKPRPEMRLEPLGPAAGRLDGGHGLGHLVMNRAADESIHLARQAGAGWVAVTNSTHCGALAFYGLKMAKAGMIGLVFTHVDPMVLPYASLEAFCGTNPICITAPGSPGESLCLDMATSVTPWNSIENAAMEGVEIPMGWAVDAEGCDTADPTKVSALYPFGGYKGSGLGLMIDVLCSMLGNSPFGPDIPKMYGDLSAHRRLGGLVGAIDVTRFVPLETFQQRVSELIHRWGLLKPMQPGQRVLYPGEPERLHREIRLRDGIPVGVQLIEKFNELAGESGVPPLNEKQKGRADT